jgi:uncharacterized C2H2 Zn-finger protein
MNFPMTIDVRIRDFPCEGVLACQMVCNGIKARLQSEYPAAEVKVLQSIRVPNGFEVIVSCPSTLSTHVEHEVRKIVQASLDRLGADYRRVCEEKSKLDTNNLTLEIYQLKADKKALEVVLRELTSVTEYLLLTTRGFDREVAQKAIAEAEGVLGCRKPRYIGEGPLTLAEMVRALRNIGFDLTCDHCAAVFYAGKSSSKHSVDCHTQKGTVKREIRRLIKDSLTSHCATRRHKS